MAILPKTVGELRKILETYPDDLEVLIQGDTVANPNATPDHFVIEMWETSRPPFLLLAGIPYEHVAKLHRNNPNASWNLPK